MSGEYGEARPEGADGEDQFYLVTERATRRLQKVLAGNGVVFADRSSSPPWYESDDVVTAYVRRLYQALPSWDGDCVEEAEAEEVHERVEAEIAAARDRDRRLEDNELRLRYLALYLAYVELVNGALDELSPEQPSDLENLKKRLLIWCQHCQLGAAWAATVDEVFPGEGLDEGDGRLIENERRRLDRVVERHTRLTEIVAGTMGGIFLSWRPDGPSISENNALEKIIRRYVDGLLSSDPISRRSWTEDARIILAGYQLKIDAGWERLLACEIAVPDDLLD